MKFLQIWLFPNKLNVQPRYDQITLNLEERKNKLQQIISPDPAGPGTWIHQDAWFHMGIFEKGKELSYDLKNPGNGVYIFVVKGSFTVDGQALDTRDGLGITDTKQVNITANEDNAEVLIMEVPMQVPQNS